MIRIIRFEITNRDQLVACINSISKECPWMVSDHFVPNAVWEQALSEQLPGALILLAVDGERVIGFCRLFPLDEKELELGIGVRQEYHHQGIASRMLDHVIDWAVQQGHQKIILETHLDNLPAHQLFYRYGFQKIKKVNMLYRMALQLQPQAFGI